MERSRMKRLFFLSVLIVMGFLSAAVGSSQDWASLKEASRNIQSVKAEFLQKRNLQILTKPLLSEGRFFFYAPGFLRWEYLSPLRSVMLQKGDTIRPYHFSEGVWKPEMTQAVESRRMVLAEISQWFQGRFDESKAFTHLYSPGPPARVILTPKEGINRFIQRIEIVLSARPGVIDRVEIEEPGGSRTSIEFRNVEINSSLPSEIFEKP
jgi:outer membrane lipoprotein-sorting protein